MYRKKLYAALFMIALVALLIVPRFRAAASLPEQLSDDAFWKLVETSPEASGHFQSENFLSNETGFQAVIPTLQRTVTHDGIYMGVGPEQNFTYISAVHPKMAFIIDIRRQN